MVPLNTFVARAPESAPFPGTTLAQAIAALNAMGYRFVRKDEGGGGTLTHDGVTVEAVLLGGTAATKLNPAYPVESLELSLKLVFNHEIELDPTWGWGDPPDLDRPVVFMPHLGGTVDVTGRLRMENKRVGGVRMFLDGFWHETAAYAAAHRGSFTAGKEPNWRTYRFPDKLTLPAADDDSLRRVFRSWGWIHEDPYYEFLTHDMPDPYWRILIRVKGVPMELMQDWRPAEEKRHFKVFARPLVRSRAAAQRWYAESGKRLGWDAVDGGEGNFTVGRSFTLGPEMTLARFRGAFLQIAKGLAPPRRSASFLRGFR